MASPEQDLAPALDNDGVRLTVDDALATVTLTNPAKRNAQSPALWRGAGRGRAAAAGLPSAWSCCAARGKSFSAGLDRRMFTPEGIPGEPTFVELARRDDAGLDATIAEFQEAFTWWRRTDIVSIAAVQGHAIGAGFQLALGCDLRVVADDVQFAMRETSLGLVPDLTGTHPLVGLVGYARALEICATGRFVGAEEAVSSGLANLAVPAAELDAAMRDLATACWRRTRRGRETKALLPRRGGPHGTTSSARPSAPPRRGGCGTWPASANEPRGQPTAVDQHGHRRPGPAGRRPPPRGPAGPRPRPGGPRPSRSRRGRDGAAARPHRRAPSMCTARPSPPSEPVGRTTLGTARAARVTAVSSGSAGSRAAGGRGALTGTPAPASASSRSVTRRSISDTSSPSRSAAPASVRRSRDAAAGSGSAALTAKSAVTRNGPGGSALRRRRYDGLAHLLRIGERDPQRAQPHPGTLRPPRPPAPPGPPPP